MPIYEYQCNACGHLFEKRQKMSDDPVTECPKCSKKEVQRLVSAAGFQLKGSGWYATDYKKPTKTENTSDTQSKSKSDDKSNNKFETKKEGSGE